MYDAVKDFEEDFKKFAGARHAIAVSNGTACLQEKTFRGGMNK